LVIRRLSLFMEKNENEPQIQLDSDPAASGVVGCGL
jgi:hypothetical protein